jgi:hypothetical protein
MGDGFGGPNGPNDYKNTSVYRRDVAHKLLIELLASVKIIVFIIYDPILISIETNLHYRSDGLKLKTSFFPERITMLSRDLWS